MPFPLQGARDCRFRAGRFASTSSAGARPLARGTSQGAGVPKRETLNL